MLQRYSGDRDAMKSEINTNHFCNLLLLLHVLLLSESSNSTSAVCGFLRLIKSTWQASVKIHCMKDVYVEEKERLMLLSKYNICIRNWLESRCGSNTTLFLQLYSYTRKIWIKS